MQLVFKGRSERHPLWSPETFLSDLEKYRIIKKVCVIYAGEEKWRGYYADVWRWRKTDPELDRKVSAILAEEGKDPKGGRPPLLDPNGGWMDDFCSALYKFNGNRDKASKVVGYSLRQINEMLDTGASSYNEEFSRRVAATVDRIVSELEEMLISLREDKNFATFNDAKIAQTKGWIALKTLEKLDPKRYGRRAELNVSGTVQHQHRLERTKSREELLSDLYEDQKRFMDARKNSFALEPGEQQPVVIEAEVVGEKIEVPNPDKD